MQQAARTVAQENARLRSLLATLGVSTQQVDAYLSTYVDVPEPRDLQADVLRTRCDAGQGQVGGGDSASTSIPLRNADGLYGHTDPYNNQAVRTIATLNSNQQAAEHDTPPHAIYTPPDSLDPSLHHPATSPAISITTPPSQPHHSAPIPGHHAISDTDTDTDAQCPNTTTCFCAPTTTIPTPALQSQNNSNLEISCDTAATIIAGMRGDGDTESIRASLGCVGSGECQVRNTTVLSIMDEG
jgi:hypothetical protein